MGNTSDGRMLKAAVDLCGSTQDFMKPVMKTVTGEMKPGCRNAKYEPT
jgi:hypothetical protein